MEELSEIIGARIKEKREKVGISQKELADNVGKTPSAINQYESGAKKPSTDILAKIAKALKTSTDFLLGITDKDDYEISVIFRDLEKLTEKDRDLISENIKLLKRLSESESRK
jgi:transcriptional regulator with XRE-family HTH domain